MTDQITAVAQAIGKSADCGTQALKSGEKAGGFLARVFKEPIEVGAGIVTDQLQLIRLRRLDATADEVGSILKRRGITDTRAVSPKLGIPLLQAAALEDTPELQKLWSHLLANAMDPSYTDEVRTAYTDIIKDLSAIDARILFLLYNSLPASERMNASGAERSTFSQEAVRTKLGISEEDYVLSISNLMRVQCVEPALTEVELGHGLTSHGDGRRIFTRDTDNGIVVTALGMRFVEACTDELDPEADSIPTRYIRRLKLDADIRMS